jgi:putative redox protein
MDHLGAVVDGEIGRTNYQVALTSRGHTLLCDEDLDDGGGDAGMSPFGLLLSSLGACTVITLRMYAERKGWTLDCAKIHLALHIVGDTRWIERRLHLVGTFDEAQRARMLAIAEKTPITRLVAAGCEIRTFIDQTN